MASPPWIEVWTRPGAPNYGKKIADLPFLDASVTVPYSGVGKGSVTVPTDFDRLDEILYINKFVDLPDSQWSTIKVMDDSGWLYEWLPIPRTPTDGSKTGISEEFAGDGLEMMWGFARVEPWDWDGSASFVSTFPDWIWGGRNLLSNPDFEDSTAQPIIDELWLTGPDPDEPDDGIGGTFTISDGVNTTVPLAWNISPSLIEIEMEAAGIYDDVLVAGSGTESDPWVIEAVEPPMNVDIIVNDAALTPAASTSHIRRVQFGALMPGSWSKSGQVSSGTARLFGVYDSFRVSGEQVHSGENALRIDPGLVESTSTRYAGAQQVVTVKPGGVYQAKVWVYPTSATDTYRFIIRGIDEDFIKAWPGGLSSSVLTANQWNELTIDDVPVGANSAVIFRVATTAKIGVDPSVFYIDDAEFNEGMMPTTVGCMLQQLYADAAYEHQFDGNRMVWWNENTMPTVSSYLHLDFDCENDSNGIPWDRAEVNQTFTPRMSYLQVIDQIVEEGAYDWRVVPDSVELGTYLLQVYNPGDLGSVQEAGIIGGSSETSRSARFFAPSATEIVAEGEDNRFERAITPGLVEAFGRIEGSILDQNWVTPGSIWSAARMALDETFHGAESIVYNLASPVQRPLVAYRPGDRIRVHDLPIVNEYRRVSQIQLSMNKSQPDEFTVHISDAIPFRFLGGAGVKVARGLHGQAATDNAVAALLKAYKKTVRNPLPSTRIIGGGGQMTVTVAASNATDQSKGKADLTCEGVNDDQVIQQAFDMLGGRGGKVVLSEGRFHFGIVGVITPPVPFHLHGMGQGATEIFADTMATPYFFLNGVATGESEHQMISDMSMNGSDKAVSAITCVSTLGSDNRMRVENVIVHDFTSHGVNLPRPAGSWQFRRCNFYANGGNGVQSREAGVDYVDCVFYANATGGVGIQQDGNSHIRGCFFWSNGGPAIASGNAISQGFSNFIITDNIFLTNTGCAISIQDGDNNLIAHNIFQGNTGGSICLGAGAFGVANNTLVMGNNQVGSGTFITVASGSSSHTVMNVINGVLTAGGGADFLSTTTSTFHQGGVLATGAGTFKLPWTTSGTIVGVRAAVGVAPAGAAIIVDVNKNGTSIFSSSANQPTVPAGSTVGAEATTIASPAMVSGDYLTVDIDQIGSTTPGEDLVVVVEWRVTA